MLYHKMSVNINGSTMASDDAHKRKQIQQQLILIFHACRCQKHFEMNGVLPCSSPHCAMMREVLSHMAICNQEKLCPYTHCSTSKRILSHWKRCGKLSCLICAPIKSRQQAVKTNLTYDNGDNNDIKCENKEEEYTTNSYDRNKCVEYKSEPVDKSKDWKNGIKDLRKRLINRIVEAILPVKDCGKAYKDQRMSNIIDHAKKIENDTFIKSNNIDEYYRTLAESCYAIHKKVYISQVNSEPSSVNCPEISAESPISIIDNIVNNNINKVLCSSPNKDSSDSDHLNKFNKILQNEYERQRKLLLINQTNDNPAINEKVIVTKTEIKQECLDVKGIEINDTVKRWTRNELIEEFKELFDYIKINKTAHLFLNQVDTKVVVEYSKMISKTITLPAIQQKLEEGSYNDPWDIVDDFNLLIKNSYAYSKRNRKFKKEMTQIMSDIQVQIDNIMVRLGYCCGREEVYQPLTLLCCTANVCTINKDSVYYAHQIENSEDSKDPGMLVDSYLCCEKCYSESGSDINFIGESNDIITVKKELLVKKRNNVEINEEFIQCKDCHRKWHKVCACYLEEIWTVFCCKQCENRRNIKMENKYTAKRLPTCVLSNFLEKRVNDYLKKNELASENITIRVVSSTKKVNEVKKGMRALFPDMPKSYPYRTKAIFAFQDYQGREVCFFGLHVQEYGSECPEPNRRRVYVAYLDSVRFFEPSKHRTKVYYEILVGYLDYVKKLGYVMAHIWACPPSEGDDYIFHIHPPDQKIPKPKRLQEWYTKMLDKGIQELVVDDYKDILKDAVQAEFKSTKEIPYFDGDFWPNLIEEILKEFDENNRKLKEYAHEDDNEDEEADDIRDTIGNKKPKKRKQKKAAGIITSKRRKFYDPSDKAEELHRKVLEIMEKHKDNFFVIRLHPEKNIPMLKETNDPDSQIESELMDGRENFLQLSRAKHLEFSCLRRVLFSTLVLCYELHNESKQTFCYTCNACNAQIETRYHCSQCYEYDLCQRCYVTEKHEHKLQMIRSGIDDDGDNGRGEGGNCEETRRIRVDRFIKSLQHAAACRDVNCRMANCLWFKTKINHSKGCKTAVSCQHCKQLFRLSALHAKYCPDPKCLVPFCQQIKLKLKRQENQQRYHQKQILRRRTANMRFNSSAAGAVANSNPLSATSAGDGSAPPAAPQAYQPLSNSSNSASIDYPSSVVNPTGTTVINQSFVPKNAFVHQQQQQQQQIPPGAVVNDNHGIYQGGGGGYPQSIGNKGHLPPNNELVYVENVFNTFMSQSDGHAKFTEWLNNNPNYNAVYRCYFQQQQQQRQFQKPHMMQCGGQVYGGGPGPSMMHVARQRVHGGGLPQPQGAQMPFYGGSMMLPQQQQQQMPGGGGGCPVNQGYDGGKVRPGAGMPMQMHINRGLPMAGHPMNNYSPSSGPPPQFLMNGMNFSPVVAPNHHSQQQQQQQVQMRFAGGNYGHNPSVISMNPQSPQVLSKMLGPQKQISQAAAAQLNFQSTNPNDPHIYRSNQQLQPQQQQLQPQQQRY